MQELAEQLGVDIHGIVHLSLGIPEIQLAEASLSAATGNIFSCENGFYLKYFEEQATQISPPTQTKEPKVVSVYAADGRAVPMDIFQLIFQCILISRHLPLLEGTIIPILVGLSRTQSGQTHLAWEKEQLSKLNTETIIRNVPCLPEEIIQLEQVIGASLPAAYVEFLAWMGHSSSEFMRHLDCFYPSLIHFQQAAHDLLAKDNSLATLPDDAFVFFFQPEQSFAFFRTSEGDNPPVYAHRQDWRHYPFRQIYYHFSDFLAIQIALHVEHRCVGPFTPVTITQESMDELFILGAKIRNAINQKLALKAEQGEQ
ncbi:SMI1/KNR4 family protein [Ktedonobacter robiniae]|nr:SMI1/KNR4 family protein [Ktedonobacter robiniae]